MNHIFPSNFVYWEKLSNHQKIKEKYLQLILKDSEENYLKYQKNNSWNCKVTTNFFEKDINPLFDEYFVDNIIKKPIDKCIHELKLKKPSYSRITSLWYNVYQEGEYQEIHQHSGQLSNFLSGIYLLELKGKNTTGFYQSGPRPDINTFGYTFLTDHIDEGNVIIFPSSLEHYVNPVFEDKVSVAFNVSTIYEYD